MHATENLQFPDFSFHETFGKSAKFSTTNFAVSGKPIAKPCIRNHTPMWLVEGCISGENSGDSLILAYTWK
jgi:hypothetical protein